MSINMENEQINIFDFRVLSRYPAQDIQDFFQEKRILGIPVRTKEPLTVYINNAGSFNEYPVESINNVIMQIVDDPVLTFQSSKKIKMELSYKVMLVVKYEGIGTYELITLPDDIGVKCTTLYDLTEKQISHSIYQTFQWVGNRFLFTMTVPISEFDRPVPVGLDLIGTASMNSLRWNAEIGEVTFDGTSSPPVPSTRVDISIGHDYLLRVGIEDEITVNGTVD